MHKSPFFIVGTGRCGTQLLRNMLNKNPEVKVIPETHFFSVLYEKYGTGTLTCSDFLEVVLNMFGSGGKQWICAITKDTGRSLSSFSEEFTQYCGDSGFRTLREYMELFYTFFYGKDVVIGDKTPHYGIYAVELKQLWPNSKFIHLVRDGVDVAFSMSGHPAFIKYINGKVAPKELDKIMFRGKNLELPSNPVYMEQALVFWEELFFAIKKVLDELKEDDVCTVHYEELLLKPVEKLKELSNFLELNINGSWIEKAAQLPRPFPERRQIMHFEQALYNRYASIIKVGMKQAGYPINIPCRRGIAGVIKELWRCRNYYIGMVNPLQWSKKLIKKRRKKMMRGV